MTIIMKFCPDCGIKTLEVEKGFTHAHCTSCGYFFTLDRDLNEPQKGVFFK